MSNKQYPDITYSYSRAKMLKACERSYYYNYYGSFGGGRKDAPQKTKLIYTLKQLQGLQSVVGEAIHAAIATLIVNPELSWSDFKRSVNKKIQNSYRNSISRRVEWMDDPKLFTMMQEVYYFGEVKLETQASVINKIDACGKNLRNCKSLSDIRANSIIYTIDDLKEFDFNGIRTYIKVDALYQQPISNEFVVVDWKIGKGCSMELEQLLLYVFFIQKIYGIPIEAIEARLEYLEDGDCASYRFNQQDMLMAEEIVANDIRYMQKYLFDVASNAPLPEVYFKTNKSSKCKSCNYHALCFESVTKVTEKSSEPIYMSVNC